MFALCNSAFRGLCKDLELDFAPRYKSLVLSHHTFKIKKKTHSVCTVVFFLILTGFKEYYDLLQTVIMMDLIL